MLFHCITHANSYCLQAKQVRVKLADRNISQPEGFLLRKGEPIALYGTHFNNIYGRSLSNIFIFLITFVFQGRVICILITGGMFSLLKPHEDMQRMVLRPRTWNAGAVIVPLPL